MYGTGTTRPRAYPDTFKLALMRVSDSTVKEYNRGLSNFFEFVGPKWKAKTPEEVDYWINQFALRIYDDFEGGRMNVVVEEKCGMTL